MTRRIAIISDTHLGPKRARLRSAAQLAPLWQGCDELIVNGDVAEIHDARWCAKAAREILALQDLCAADGVELSLLSGNHDPLLSDTRHRLLAGGRVLVMHGDAVHAALAPWSTSAPRVRAAHEHALGMLDATERRTLEARLAACQHAAHSDWLMPYTSEGFVTALLQMSVRPWLAWRVLHAWAEFPGLTADFAERFAPSAQVVIVGHTHRPAVTHVRGRTVVNTGSFPLPGPARMVILEGDRLAIHDIRRHRGTYVARGAPRSVVRLDRLDEHRDAA